MTEIKVGDKCKLNGYVRFCDGIEVIFLDDVEGEILHMGDHPKITVRLHIDSSPVVFIHRKQCRKLVKMRKCEACDGWGETGCCDKFCCKDHKCEKCNGKGRVKE